MIGSFGGECVFTNLLIKNLPLLTSAGLDSLLSYAKPDAADTDAVGEAKCVINTHLDTFMNSTEKQKGVSSFFYNNSMGLLQFKDNDLVNRVDPASINNIMDHGLN